MRLRDGFTLVELLITITIMTILFALGVVALGNIQAQARDKERETDVQAIARGLENYYKKGNPYYIGTEYVTPGTYPGSNMMISISGSGWCAGSGVTNPSQDAKYSKCSPGQNYYTDVLPGTKSEAFIAPGKSSPELVNPWLGGDCNDDKLLCGNMTSALNDGKYVYKPMESAGKKLCYSDGSIQTRDNDNFFYEPGCSRFVLLYKSETTGEIVEVWSKNQ